MKNQIINRVFSFHIKKINNFIINYNINQKVKQITELYYLGIGDWGLGIGDWC